MSGRRLLVVAALAACSTDEVKDPSYLLVQLNPVASGAVVPGAARVEVKSGSTTIATLCVNLGDGSGATLALKRDPAKDQGARITIEVSAYETLSGQTNAGAGDEFTCPTTLPPALSDPQSVSVQFCAAQSKRIVFHVGATCGCAGDGGVDDGGAASSSSSVASSGSTGGGGSGGSASGGAGGNGSGGGFGVGGGTTGAGGATVGAGGSGGTGGAGTAGGGGASGGAGGASSTSSSSSSGAGGGGGGSPGCGCGSGQTCGAGISTEGRACGPNECCNITISTACALEPLFGSVRN